MDKARWQRVHHLMVALEVRYRERNNLSKDADVSEEIGACVGVSRSTWSKWRGCWAELPDPPSIESNGELIPERPSPEGPSFPYDGLVAMAIVFGVDVLSVVCVIEGATPSDDIPLPTRVALASKDVQAACLEAIALELRDITPPQTRKTKRK
jgi:hypothetical protein